MPTYEYACTACGERTEAKQSFSDPPLDTCPHCGGKLRKLYSPVGVVFKGSGFYSTDAKKSSAGDKASSSSAEKSSGDSGKEPGKESSKESGTKTDGKASPTTASSGEKSS